ncbi:hypothetical protein NL108_010380 [Boleophthalmus pectinirostris]|uniref:uncharacterized protein LOC110161215 n=1 Tax=Boleophthalmus pectinirostris TaxID=150288 RepID=UPI000A1C2574|nr:uncharacterized protein LOC110161215 [Boleophthalmus pectinirostris]KAJ0056554.1 hypothetical protein NL108_010380 [Boleophthalmus pectinirostris]
MEDSPVDGGVLLVHEFTEGKHQYEVKSVIKQKGKRKKEEEYFIRRGDRLRMVNNSEIEDVPPEQLAEILAKGSPMLTLHKTIRKKQPVEKKPSDEDVMVPISKEERILCFNRMMRREEEQEQENLLPTGKGEEDECTEDDEQSDFLVVSMMKTTISVITGRSCDPKDHCYECSQDECKYNDIVMMTESSSVTLVPRGGGSFRCLKFNEVEVTTQTFRYLHCLCDQKQVYMSDYPERVTLYYYKSDKSDNKTSGMPVVVNFSESNCFLKCCKVRDDDIQLRVETCEKQKLRSISKNDHEALAFVFYMKSERTRGTTFESALHVGWFIETTEVNTPRMAKEGERFIIVIEKKRA